MTGRLLRFLALPFAAVLTLALLAGSACAGSWIFRPSYYSHDWPQARPPRVVGALAPGPYAVVPVWPRGYTVRSGWRTRNDIIHTGDSIDRFLYSESFIQFGEQW